MLRELGSAVLIGGSFLMWSFSQEFLTAGEMSEIFANFFGNLRERKWVVSIVKSSACDGKSRNR